MTNARPERRAPGRGHLGSMTRPAGAGQRAWPREPARPGRTGSHWALCPNRAWCGGRRSLQDAGHECSHRKELATKALQTGGVPTGEATRADLRACPKQGHCRAETRACEPWDQAGVGSRATEDALGAGKPYHSEPGIQDIPEMRFRIKPAQAERLSDPWCQKVTGRYFLSRTNVSYTSG